MIPKEAILKAVKGGWKNQENTPVSLVSGYTKNWERAALDATFWQSLGKELEHRLTREWEDKAMEFYYLILTGGDTDKFWQELLQ